MRLPSEVEVDWIFTYPLSRIDGVIGSLGEATITEVDRTLRRWLDL